RGHPAARRFLGQILRAAAGGRSGSLSARGHRRAGERRGRLLLSAHRQNDVFRRAGAGIRSCAARAARDLGDLDDLSPCLLDLSGAADDRGERRGEIAVLIAGQGFALGNKARAEGVRLIAFDESDSTNEEARRRVLEEGERGPLWIVATRQSRGRGRLGRDWVSVPGNLHASLVLSDGVTPERAPQLGFVAGVA